MGKSLGANEINHTCASSL